jgi:molybdate transport system substrate-binding protein
MKNALIVVAALLVLSIVGAVALEAVLSSDIEGGQGRLVVLAAWEVKPALAEIVASYEKQSKRRVDVRYGTSRTLLAQLKLSESGDLFICASERECKRALDEGLVPRWFPQPLAYLVPAMIMRPNAPVAIAYATDLLSEGARLVIADPELDEMGQYAAELVESIRDVRRFGERVRELVVAMPPSGPEAVELVELGEAEVAIAWRVMQQWDPVFLDAKDFDPEEILRVCRVSVGRTAFCRDVEAAKDFLDFLAGPDAQAILAKWRYITRRADARRAAPEATIGGEPHVPPQWRQGAQDETGGAGE